MANIRKIIGNWGEKATSLILASFGYEIICRNYRLPAGEIDLIGWDRGELVFVEVKTRRFSIFGTGEESITEQKERRLAIAANTYMSSQGYPVQAFRIDLAILEIVAPGFYVFRYLRGVIGDVNEDALDAP